MLILGIFLSTLFCILMRPFGLRIWLYSSVGALFVFIFGLVGLEDLEFIFSLIWDSSLTLIALIVLSLCLESLGFFERLIGILLGFCEVKSRRFPARKCHTNTHSESPMRYKSQHTHIIHTRKLFFVLFVCAGILSAMFANDGAILILTPLVIGIWRCMKFPHQRLLIVLLFMISFLCDATSNAFIISNLTNIITANYFHLGFLEFARTMALPNIITLCGTIMLFFMIFRTLLPKYLRIERGESYRLSNTQFIVYCVILGFFVLAFFVIESLHFSISMPCILFALIFLILLFLQDKSKTLNVLRHAPYGIVIFSFGLFVVVFALYKHELGSVLQGLFAHLSDNTFVNILSVGLLSTFGASVFNNLPMVLLGNLSLQEFYASGGMSEMMNQALIYAHLLACNIGSKLTPIGSLCTLLWLEILRKNGVIVGFKTYFSLSFIFTLPILFMALVGLWVVIL